MNHFESHHCGPVTALTVYPPYVVSGAGDGFVKVWSPASRSCVRTLQGHHGSVLTLLAGREEGVVISGSRDGTIKVWDMESFSCRRTLRGHNDDVLSLAIWEGFLFSGAADGGILVWRVDSLTFYQAFQQVEQGVQSLVATQEGQRLLFSGLQGGTVLAWDMPQEASKNGGKGVRKEGGRDGERRGDGEDEGVGGPELVRMEECLSEFVSYQSVSVSEEDFHKEECWRCAKFLTSLLERLGASVKMVSLVEGKSPVVLARFGNQPDKPTVTLYGHYDVVPASERTWKTDPFVMMALNGYLYGRGVTDNKGPIMAMIFALKEMKEQGILKDMNAVLLLEGEEETSSEGFREAVLQNLHWFRGTGLILQANSTWIADDRPCLTYGMRGTIHLEVRVHGPKRNLHSGIDGGAVVEPLNDLVGILATLVDARGMVLVPDFYAEVEEVSQEELELFDAMNLNIDAYKASLGVKGLTCNSGREVLAGRWRQPTLSINQVASSNPTDSYSILPKAAMAKISVRTVPRQNPSRLVDLIRAHLKHEFGKRRSPNDLFVEVKKIGDWWYGDRGAHAFEMAEKAIEEVWHQPPLYVREGGTMPITAFLEDLLKAPALHLPLGQSTDNAHLPNERIRYLNLTNGKEIIKSILRQVGESGRARVGNGGSSVLKEGQVQGNGHGEAHRSLHTEKMGEEPMALPVPQARRAVSVPLSLLPASASGTHAHLTPLQTEPLVTRPTIARSAVSLNEKKGGLDGRERDRIMTKRLPRGRVFESRVENSHTECLRVSDVLHESDFRSRPGQLCTCNGIYINLYQQ
ncbi:zn-dependent exopeptidase [Nannochloropsis gaditana]|uniref:Zn-dependent exopeptidase n=1 Tax=Nannochloropsis gaditana TaxID=72520 RepID=W7U518_9STRA|nr:zn-dependent exopeptidase [Nannochloropsis gaditana]